MVEESIVFRPDIPDRDIKRETRKVDRELQDAGTINPEIGDVSGDLDFGGMGGGGGLRGSGPGSPLRNMSGGIEDLVPMADYRNRLLEDILDGVQAGGGGGGGGGILSRLFNRFGRIGKLIFGGGAVALGALIASKLNPVNLAGILGDKIGDVLPSDLVDPVTITADMFLGSGLPIGVETLVSSSLPLSVGALLASVFPLGIGSMLSSAFPINVSDILDSGGESGSGTPSGGGSGFTLGQLFAGGAGLAGLGALAKLGLSGGGLSLPTLFGGGAGAGGAAAGSITAGGLATLGAGGAGILGTILGGRELGQIATGGEGIEPITAAGRDFAESNQGIADFIETGFTQNPIFDAGSAVGSFFRGTAGRNRRRPQIAPQSSVAPQQPGLASPVQIDANVSVDATDLADIDRRLDQEFSRLKDEAMRELERDLSNGGRP